MIRLVLILTLVLGCIALAVTSTAVLNQREAERSLQLIREVRNGSTLNQRQLALLRAFSAECHPQTSIHSEYCTYTRSFEKTWLQRLKLAPLTKLIVTLVVSDKNVLETTVAL